MKCMSGDEVEHLKTAFGSFYLIRCVAIYVFMHEWLSLFNSKLRVYLLFLLINICAAVGPSLD